MDADLSGRPSCAHPKKNQGTEHVWAGRGGLSPGASWAGPPSQLLGTPGPLGPLRADAQAAASPAACWLWETAVVLAAGGIEAGGFKGLRDRILKGLQKPGFSSMGFAALLVPPG